MTDREWVLEEMISGRAQRQLKASLSALGGELRRAIVAMYGIRDVLLQVDVPHSVLVEMTDRVDKARDLADLLEMTGVRAGHAAENTTFRGVKP